jgi:DNA-binding transcriptional ArsR family regulator
VATSPLSTPPRYVDARDLRSQDGAGAWGCRSGAHLAGLAGHLSSARIPIARGRSLGSINERLAFDLLDRASRSQLADGRLEARATHEDLASSIGSSREVVSRTLKGLRSAGIVETAPRITRVLDPARLAAIAQAFVN